MANSASAGSGKTATQPRGFFDEHPRFLETSTTAIDARRLNVRHRELIERNRDILAGARVLDIASHDGRWSLAALDAGAAHVTGVEARAELVEHAEQTFATYGATRDSYRFVTGDVFEVLARESLDVDVIQCFGFVYHTLRYPELFSRLRRLEPEYLLLDTRVEPGSGQVIKVLVNKADRVSHAAVDDYTEGTTTLVGWPTPAALRLMLRVYGFQVEQVVDWSKAAPAEKRLMGRYKHGKRVTWRCAWKPPS